jgi:formate dehydrogenase (coenzyme F420) beta subunit
MEKCRDCRYPDPVVYDQMLLEPQGEKAVPERFKAVEELEATSPEERFAYWEKELHAACAVTPAARPAPTAAAANVLSSRKTRAGRDALTSPAKTSSFTWSRLSRRRALYRLRRVPALLPGWDIPLQELNRKLIKDINELYGDYEAGLDAELEPPLLTYRPDDPAAFSEK